jgi:hypothetical protein
LNQSIYRVELFTFIEKDENLIGRQHVSAWIDIDKAIRQDLKYACVQIETESDLKCREGITKAKCFILFLQRNLIIVGLLVL